MDKITLHRFGDVNVKLISRTHGVIKELWSNSSGKIYRGNGLPAVIVSNGYEAYYATSGYLVKMKVS